VIFVLCIATQSEATHIVGGELYYNHLGGNDFEVILIVYRDCDSDNANNTGFDGSSVNLPDPVIGIYTNGNLLDVVTLPFSITNVEGIPITSENPCFILPPDLCIEKATYTTTINLPPINNGYDLVYQRCCRNNSIINIQAAEDSGMSLYAHIPGAETVAAGINQSARFINLPNVALCQGGEFFYDHSAFDADGDQLNYSFCNPVLGGGANVAAAPGDPDSPQPNPPLGPPFTSVVWANGFGENNQVAANPDLEIDPLTGQITGTPTQVGTFAVGICVQEFRNGQLLNTVVRDFQYEVTTCDPIIIAAIPNQEQFCDGLTFQFDNTSLNATFFEWDFGDLSITTDTSTQQAPLYTYAQEGDYEVTLIANPGWPCADTSSAVYAAYPPLEVIEPTIDFNCIDDVPVYELEAQGTFDEDLSSIEWNFPAAFDPSGTDAFSETISGPNSGTFGVSLTVTENGCDDSFEFTMEVPEPPEAILPPQTLFCEGFTFDFVNSSVNAESYSWDFGVIGSANDVSSSFEPSYTYSSAGLYTVTLEASAPMTCPSVTQTDFDIQELLDPFFENPDPQCFNGHSFDFEATGFSSPNPIFDWQFGDLADPEESSSQFVNNVTWSEFGNYPVTLTISENDCVKSIQQGVELIQNPEPNFNLFLSEGCPPLSVTFSNQSSGGQNLSYLWDFGDGNTSTSVNPTHEFIAPGFYDITLSISSTIGCLQDVSFTQNDAIQVYPSPTAGFIADVYEVSFLEPQVTITDISVGGSSCFYDFGDGSTSFDCDLVHSFLDAGFFDVTQTVSNNFGCFK